MITVASGKLAEHLCITQLLNILGLYAFLEGDFFGHHFNLFNVHLLFQVLFLFYQIYPLHSSRHIHLI